MRQKGKKLALKKDLGTLKPTDKSRIKRLLEEREAMKEMAEIYQIVGHKRECLWQERINALQEINKMLAYMLFLNIVLWAVVVFCFII